MLHLARPFEKPPQISALVPEEFPELQEADLLHLDPAVGFNSPEQIRTAPWRQAMATGGVPHEAEHVAHA